MSENVFKEGDVVNTFLSRYHIVKKNNELIAVPMQLLATNNDELYLENEAISIEQLSVYRSCIVIGNSVDNAWLGVNDFEIYRRLVLKEIDF